tara:strand:+ start:43 stop:198 length:156 start_codon:yes stop_codon:yes gene_type:complete
MYRGEMEPSWLIEVYPLGWGVGWAVAMKQVLAELSKAEEPRDRLWTAEVMG